MAGEEKSTYPKIPLIHWWELRNKFKQSFPASVTPGYLAAALGMKEESAKANILPALLTFKVIDQDGKPTDRARQWRDDEQYHLACEAIRQEAYPQELLDALPPPSPDREAVVRWFANKTRVGEAAARQMALVYILLCYADPIHGQDVASPAPAKTAKKKSRVAVSKPAETTLPVHKVSSANVPQERPSSTSQITPSIHIDIQIHLSPDISTTQIDQIFASMAKHLCKLVSKDE